jgi:long-chain acyl-CoA synthetase
MKDPKVREFFLRLAYPNEWVEDGALFSQDDAYIAHDPEWDTYPMPPLPNTPIHSFLAKARDPGKTALVCMGATVSYADLDELSSRLASGLERFGVQEGDRVATLLPNCIQQTLAFFAASKLGAILVPNNVMYTRYELERQLNDSGAKVLIGLDALSGNFEGLNAPCLEHTVTTGLMDMSGKGWLEGDPPFLKLLRFDPIQKARQVSVEDVALMIYTSGTTGTPKGAMITHKNLWANVWVARFGIGILEDDVDLQIMPTFHCSGWDLAQIPTLFAGGQVVLVPLFEPAGVLRLIKDHKVSIILAPPTFYVALLSQAGFGPKSIESVRIAISCGAPLPDPLRTRFEEATKKELWDGYGLTETNCGGTACLSYPKKNKPGSVGVVTLGEMKIVGSEGNVLKRNEVGEVCFRGFGVVKGYFNRPEETAKAFDSQGWFHTQDAGYLDDEGFFVFVDRYKDLIVASGYNIAPYEIECALMEHPAVQEAAVIGVSDPYRGEVPKAFIVLRPGMEKGVTKEDILGFLKERLAKFKIPKDIVFMPELPKNPVGKILRRELKDREASGLFGG